MARQNDHKRAEELISAYLDKQVSAEEQEFFERHTASCANCRAQLESTRSMVVALRALPAMKAPRSFVLPREMAKQPRQSFLSLYPVLRLATVVAALAFVVLFAGDLLINRAGTTGAPPSIPARAPLALQAPAAPHAAAPTQAPAAAEAYSAAATAPAMPAAPAAGAASMSATAPLTESTALSMPTTAPEATASADKAMQMQKMPEATPTPTEATLAQHAAPAAEQPAAANVAAAAPNIDPLRVIEVAMLALAIVLGIATFLVRRKVRRKQA